LSSSAYPRNCPKCKKPRAATKSLSLSRLPPVLIIHLKRFSSKNGVFWDKAETLVDYPVRSLDLTKYLPPPLPASGPDSHASQTRRAEDPRDQTGPFVYELYGVSNHSGSLSGGHYTAFVKSARRHWKYCDDRTISEADEKDLVSKNAYILFYRRVPVKRSSL
jgi:ubiquitin carboxyl-terminal hydrolase 8